MKKLLINSLIIAFIVCFIAALSSADDIFENTDLGAKVDVPNIIKKGNHSIGAEISIFDITENWDEGSQAYVKYTYSGVFFGDK